MLFGRFRLVARLASFTFVAISLTLAAPAGLAAPPDGKGKPGGGGGGGGGGSKHSPVANDDSTSAATGAASAPLDVLANDTDPRGSPLSLVSVTEGQFGSVTIDADGKVIYTPELAPASSLPFDDTFTYVVTNEAKKPRTATGTVTVSITGLAPTADAGPDQNLADSDSLAGEGVTLDGSDSTDSNNDIVSYAWSWEGGGSASGVNPSVNLPDGVTEVALLVTDVEGNTDGDIVLIDITAPNVAPIADAGGDRTIADTDAVSGELVQLDGSGSADPDGSIVTFEWSWDGGSASGETPSAIEFEDGDTVVTLTVTDNDGATDTDIATISVTSPFLTVVSVWSEAEVRRVLHACCYGGQATDAQIATWGSMTPAAAIAEILSFDYNNTLLSPPEDAFATNNSSLHEMQIFWSGSDPGNPVRLDRRTYYTMSPSDNFSMNNLERTWWEAVNSRGGNPFLHKMGFFLTNHHYAAGGRTIGALMQPYYDELIGALNAGDSFTDVQYLAASSAALSRYYGHQYNRFYRNNDGLGGGTFYGNDDFAREYFQLGMRIDAADEFEYHEDVTIENMAKVLSGMDVDREYGAYDSTLLDLEYVAPIVGDTHVDEGGRLIRNASSETLTTVFYNGEDRNYYGFHHNNCVEVLHESICGDNSDQKIREITDIAAEHPEALAGLPLRIIGFLFDDNLTAAKIADLQGAWASRSRKDLLTFLRNYFISESFHSEDTYKYTNGFDYLNRLWVNNTTSNADSHANARHAKSPGDLMGAEMFEPARAVFGAQTGLDVANGPNIILTAINRRVTNGYYHYEDFIEGTAANGLGLDGVSGDGWYRDWGAVIPVNGDGEHVVDEVTEWLWNRFIGDGGENLGVVERAHIHSLLATGDDLNYRMQQVGAITLDQLNDRHYNDGDPDNGVPHTRVLFGTPELTDSTHDAYALDQGHASNVMELTSADQAIQRRENEYVGYAVNFIATLPFMFVFEGK